MGVVQEASLHTPGAEEKRSPSAILWLFAILFVIGLVAGTIHLGQVVKADEAAKRARYAAASANVPAMLSQVEQRYAGEGMAPDVVWSGRGATILSVRHYLTQMSFGHPASYVWAVLARTPSGKLFTVDLNLEQDDDACTPAEVAKCSTFSNFRSMEETDLKGYVFRVLKDEKLYRRLFNEAMPPIEVPA